MSKSLNTEQFEGSKVYVYEHWVANDEGEYVRNCWYSPEGEVFRVENHDEQPFVEFDYHGEWR